MLYDSLLFVLKTHPDETVLLCKNSMAFNILAAFSDSIIYDFHKKFKFYARCRQKEFAEYFYFAIALLQGEKENTEKLAS